MAIRIKCEECQGNKVVPSIRYVEGPASAGMENRWIVCKLCNGHGETIQKELDEILSDMMNPFGQ